MTSLGYIGAGGILRRLPYDAEVEYLESTGTQWIDTGVVPNFATETSFDGCIYERTDGLRILVGAQTNNSDPGRYFAMGEYIASGYVKFVLGNVMNTMPLAYNANRHRVVFNESGSHKVYVDGAEKFTFGSGNSVIYPNRIILFGVSGYGTNHYPAKGIIWRCRIVDGSTLVRDFIPVRFTNEYGQSEGAMFDRANPTVGMNPDGSARTDGLYRNRGTGAFLYGNDI